MSPAFTSVPRKSTVFSLRRILYTQLAECSEPARVWASVEAWTEAAFAEPCGEGGRVNTNPNRVCARSWKKPLIEEVKTRVRVYVKERCKLLDALSG